MHPIGENSSNIPAFLGKLWKMVNDPSTDHLVSWSVAGNSFVIQNQAQFWYELLPLYYKHNNMSSFVRQLNMYGFHKMSTVENGTMDADKDEIQFYHPFFQKDQPELLKNIKRKVTTSKTENNVQNVWKHDDIAKVLTDVKQLRGRQSSVDSQLSAMKQENAVLWRELAMLRQKHIKQQQIVNKLIQFLVTLVQPSATSRMGVGVKRRMPLMLHESPTKKAKSKKNTENTDGGPTIHELDSEIDLPEKLLIDVTDQPMVSSPVTSISTQTENTEELTKSPAASENENIDISMIPDVIWDRPDYVVGSPLKTMSTQTTEVMPQATSDFFDDGIADTILPDTILPDCLWDEPDLVEIRNGDELLSRHTLNEGITDDLPVDANDTDTKVFLNPTTQHTLLSNLSNGSYNSQVLKKSKNKKKLPNLVIEQPAINQSTSQISKPNSDMTVATRDVKPNNGDDLDFHLEHTQSELDQIKDMLVGINGCNTIDANALLGLFSDQTPGYGLSLSNQSASADPMVSGTELATYGNNFIDFSELLDDSLDGQTATTTTTATTANLPATSTSLTTPILPL